MRASILASAALALSALTCLASGHAVTLDQVPDPLCFAAASLILFVFAAIRRPRPADPGVFRAGPVQAFEKG